MLAYLSATGAPRSTDPDPDRADRLHLGTHPNVVARLWDVLASALDGDARAVVHGSPVLVDPGSGVIVAVGLGTTYALRLAPADYAQAIAAGMPTRHVYSTVGRTLDLATAFGEGWVFGSHDAGEAASLTRSASNL